MTVVRTRRVLDVAGAAAVSDAAEEMPASTASGS